MNVILYKIRLILFTTIFSLVYISCQKSEWGEDAFADHSQVPIERFDENIRHGDAIKTNDLLNEIGWEKLKANKHIRNDRIIERRKKLLSEYIFNLGLNTIKRGEYGEQHRESIRITSYKGYVVEYYKNIEKGGVSHTSNYFNESLWLEYVKEALPLVPEKYLLTLKQDPSRLRNYYTLLGLRGDDKYGWICEGQDYMLLTDRRSAVLEFVKEKNTYLLRKLMDYPDALVKLYVMEAMIYLDHKAKKELDYIAIRSKELYPDHTGESYGGNSASIQRNRLLLTDSEWMQINSFRESNLIIKACGDIGAYKI